MPEAPMPPVVVIVEDEDEDAGLVSPVGMAGAGVEQWVREQREIIEREWERQDMVRKYREGQEGVWGTVGWV